MYVEAQSTYNVRFDSCNGWKHAYAGLLPLFSFSSSFFANYVTFWWFFFLQQPDFIHRQQINYQAGVKWMLMGSYLTPVFMFSPKGCTVPSWWIQCDSLCLRCVSSPSQASITRSSTSLTLWLELLKLKETGYGFVVFMEEAWFARRRLSLVLQRWVQTVFIGSITWPTITGL